MILEVLGRLSLRVQQILYSLDDVAAAAQEELEKLDMCLKQFVTTLGRNATVMLVATIGVALHAQSPERFEVASIRRAEIPSNVNGVPVFPTTGGIEVGRITYRATWLRPLIAQAFGVRSNQIVGPDWLSTERYDIVANIPKGTTDEQFTRMLGNLLRERFNLHFHLESRSVDVYVLRVAKSEPKFKETVTPARAGDATAPACPGGGRDAQGFPVVAPDFRCSLSVPVNGELFMTAQGVPLARLVSILEPRVGRPIIDETGLTGLYDFKLHMEWLGRAGGAGNPPGAAPGIFTAVEEQLGLKLESARRALPHLIVDSIDRDPTDN